MEKIFKYPLIPDDMQYVKLPKGAKVLSVVVQHNAIVLYAMVNPEVKEEITYTVRIYGTGHKINTDDISGYTFHGTMPMYGGQLMFHVFGRG